MRVGSSYPTPEVQFTSYSRQINSESSFTRYFARLRSFRSACPGIVLLRGALLGDAAAFDGRKSNNPPSAANDAVVPRLVRDLSLRRLLRCRRSGEAYRVFQALTAYEPATNPTVTAVANTRCIRH